MQYIHVYSKHSTSYKHALQTKALAGCAFWLLKDGAHRSLQDQQNSVKFHSLDGLWLMISIEQVCNVMTRS